VRALDETPTSDDVEKPAPFGELNSDSQFDFSREAINTTAVDIELDSELVDSVNIESTSDLEAIHEPVGYAETLESLEAVEMVEQGPTLNSIPSVFFETSVDGHEPLYSEADFTFNTELSGEIASFEDLDIISQEPEFEGPSDVDVDKPEGREGSQARAYVVEIGDIIQFEKPTIIDDPTIGFSQTDLSVETESIDTESIDTEISVKAEFDSTEIDSVTVQSSVLVQEYSDDIEVVTSGLPPIAAKPKGVFKRFIGRAVSWIKRFVGF
jgi:hypothetical protein